MNFRPGYARWFDVWPQPADHEVRERDYFFVVSFIVWGIWAGIGLGALVRSVASRSGAIARAAPALFLLAAVPLALNWRDASRRQGADARLPADFAYDLLNSTPPYGILFTYGDNDTFPLWWAQEVAGIRRDVTVVCLALANTDWYMRQLRDAPARPLDEGRSPRSGAVGSFPGPTAPLHGMTDSMVAVGDDRLSRAGDHSRSRSGPLTRTLTDGTMLYPNDILDARRHPAEPRPAADRLGVDRRAGASPASATTSCSAASASSCCGPARHDLTPISTFTASAGVPLDVPTTERLVFDTYRYAGLLEHGATGWRAPARASQPRSGCRRRSWSTPTRAGPTDAPDPSGRSTWPPGSPPIPTSAPHSVAVVDSAARDTARPAADRTGPLQQRPNLK